MKAGVAPKCRHPKNSRIVFRPSTTAAHERCIGHQHQPLGA